MGCSEIESWLSILSAGITGLHLFKEYGFRTPELIFFLENFDSEKMEIAAFAPPPLRDQYAQLFDEANKRLRNGIVKMRNSDVAEEVLDIVLRDTTELYGLMSDMHQSVSSGYILA